jgi:L-asparaginase
MRDGQQSVVVVLATGGTIAGVQVDPTTANYTAGSFSGDQLIATVPQLARLAELRVEQIDNIGSQNIKHETWQVLATRINALFRDPAVNGVVVTHGTDTLEETAYFLSLVVRHDKPLVLVGAMRAATALSSDGAANLYNAVALAANPTAAGRGPLVVMNEDIHYAREVQKTAADGMNAFSSPNRGRAGMIGNGRAVFFSRQETCHTTRSKLTLEHLDVGQWPRVDILYAYASMEGELVDYVASRAKGIVLAGVGNGNASVTTINALTRAAARGVAVVRASRTGSGLVSRNVEVDDSANGFTVAGDLSPQKARVLLMLALACGHQRATLQACFDHY